MSLFELRNITAGYGAHSVLRGIDLTVPSDSVVALLGPNGAGKTTMLRVASGDIRPDRGAVLLDDVELTRWTSDRRARHGVCHVPEGRGIFPALTVRDNLRLQVPPDQDESVLEDALAAFPRLGERLGQKAGTLSGGEQQMLAIARAYVATPEVVLLDEVSLGLAPTIVDDIFDYLRRLSHRGVAMLLVEQYVSRALQLADYVYILNKGEITFTGEPSELGEEEIMASYIGGTARV